MSTQYVSELTSSLTTFWQAWLETEKLPKLSAGDLLHLNNCKGSTISLTEEQHDIAKHFYNLWEAAINGNI